MVILYHYFYRTTEKANGTVIEEALAKITTLVASQKT
jgi:hypothetical protein